MPNTKFHLTRLLLSFSFMLGSLLRFPSVSLCSNFCSDLWRNRRGQTTAEYALVLLGAATLATLLIAWAGQSNRVSTLFDTVLRSVTNLVS